MPSSGSRRARRALARNAHNHAATACSILRLPLELLQHVFSYVVDDASIRRHLVTPLFGMLAFHELRLVCVKFYYAVPGARREWGRRRDGVLAEKRPVWVMGEGKVRKEWGRVLRAVNGSGEVGWEGARVREWRRVLEGMGVGVWRDGEAEERRERKKLKERERARRRKLARRMRMWDGTWEIHLRKKIMRKLRRKWAEKAKKSWRRLREKIKKRKAMRKVCLVGRMG
ncbi:hypothetical protein NpPPO83_00000382 [Neofusicoccum parvum]|uniref:Uncharacterized protein n=1 Tax=Neofusicoccum parvum TaxID=310453 RepID=A0ACB5SQH5_9PEZI|nr:hypothetical protein NpPPO83_00000382 [Neofusicoccum parvum]